MDYTTTPIKRKVLVIARECPSTALRSALLWALASRCGCSASLLRLSVVTTHPIHMWYNLFP